jgi:hypothetical protein
MRVRADRIAGWVVTTLVIVVSWPYFELRERWFMLAFRMGWWRP